MQDKHYIIVILQFSNTETPSSSIKKEESGHFYSTQEIKGGTLKLSFWKKRG